MKNSAQDVIMLRLSNIPGLDITVIVVDSSGKTVGPTTAYVGPPSYEISDRPVDALDERRYMAPISSWGYHLAPGTYRVTALMHSFATKAYLRSSTISVVVTP